MPPRFAYWTIIADGLPTAFRATEREELAPTFHRLKEKHPDAEMKWFARGKLWDSPEAVISSRPNRDDQASRPRPPQSDERPASRERRGRDWRPGGEHRDARQPYKDAKKARNVARRKEKFARKTDGHGRDDRPRRDAEPGQWKDRPRDQAPGTDKPWQERPRRHFDRDGERRGEARDIAGSKQRFAPRGPADRPRPDPRHESGRPRSGQSGSDRPGWRDERPRAEWRNRDGRDDRGQHDRPPRQGGSDQRSDRPRERSADVHGKPWEQKRRFDRERDARGDRDGRQHNSRPAPSGANRGGYGGDRQPANRPQGSRPEWRDTKPRAPRPEWRDRGDREHKPGPDRRPEGRERRGDWTPRDKKPFESRERGSSNQGEHRNQRPFTPRDEAWRGRQGGPDAKTRGSDAPRRDDWREPRAPRAPRADWRDRPAKPRRDDGGGGRPPFAPGRFERNQQPDDRPAPRPPRPEREPRPSESPKPAPPPRPDEPVIAPPGPPERGRLVRKKRP